MYEKMIEVLQYLAGKSTVLAKDFGSILYKTFPSSKTREDVETVLKGTRTQRDTGNYEVYDPKNLIASQKKTAASQNLVVDSPTPEVIINKDSAPKSDVSLEELIELSEDAIMNLYGSLSNFKSFIRDTFSITVPKNANLITTKQLIKASLNAG